MEELIGGKKILDSLLNRRGFLRLDCPRTILRNQWAVFARSEVAKGRD
ncbi:hypothetical protein UF75_0340 [Desulfosporosinus sp. I2]|nr:hypothetical protein UF75_0340 [Desulfosporosinus sp. I2]